jgi:hypothetical protein
MTNDRSVRLSWLVLAGLLLVVGAAFVIGRATASDSSPEQTDERDAEDGAGPSGTTNGVPVGFSQSEDGAVAAATIFARAIATIPLDTDAYKETIRTLAAPEWLSDAEALADNSLTFLVERYGQGAASTFSPIKYRIQKYSDTSATVALWGVTLGSGPKVQQPEESWVTGTIELVWVDDDWRVAGQSSSVGPTPERLNTEDELDGSELENFEEYPIGSRY